MEGTDSPMGGGFCPVIFLLTDFQWLPEADLLPVRRFQETRVPNEFCHGGCVVRLLARNCLVTTKEPLRVLEFPVHFSFLTQVWLARLLSTPSRFLFQGRVRKPSEQEPLHSGEKTLDGVRGDAAAVFLHLAEFAAPVGLTCKVAIVLPPVWGILKPRNPFSYRNIFTSPTTTPTLLIVTRHLWMTESCVKSSSVLSSH